MNSKDRRKKDKENKCIYIIIYNLKSIENLKPHEKMQHWLFDPAHTLDPEHQFRYPGLLLLPLNCMKIKHWCLMNFL